MQLGTFTKQPGEKRLLKVNYSEALNAGDSISTCTVDSVTPSGLTVSSTTVESPVVYFTIESGTDGSEYKITLLATTTNEIFEDELTVTVTEI